ncbi:hypothetical protein K3495_g7908 [Podosphaera aphanis]|nr:hypothetical protein K3495_g7908 [Podosphaera aphanis]
MHDPLTEDNITTMIMPSDDAILTSLRRTVETLFRGPDRDVMSVKVVRQHVEDDLKLPAGFLRQGPWKEKSKSAIEACVQKLLDAETDGETDASQHPPTPKAKPPRPRKTTTTKRLASDSETRALKRQKRLPDPEISTASEQAAKTTAGHDTKTGKTNPRKSRSSPRSNTLPQQQSLTKRQSSPDSEDDEDQPPRAANRGKRKLTSTEADDYQSSALVVTPPLLPSTLLEPAKPNSDFEESRSLVEPSPRKPTVAISDHESTRTTRRDSNAEQKPAAAHNASDSDLSSVLDEPITSKRRRRPQAGKKVRAKSTKAGADATTKSSITSTTLTPDEAALKTLQTQLRKCGVTTIWQFALRKFGNDHSAKLRHLQETLREVGMVGRFSEAKAKEIKEARELRADLQAVEEGDKIWGLETKRRTGRSSKRDSMDDGHEDLATDSLKSRTSRMGEEPRKSRSAALDWLGSEEESDE